MSGKTIVMLVAVTISLWIIPFTIRILISDFSFADTLGFTDHEHKPDIIVSQLFDSFSKNDRYTAFCIIFKNNMKVCLYNIAGGITIGVSTFVNLIVNGFLAADAFVNIYKSGMSVSDIFKYTLPHSFEILGVWLSGMSGFLTAKMLLDFIRLNKIPDVSFYKYLGLGFFLTLCIISIAAYTEAFVSLPANYNMLLKK